MPDYDYLVDLANIYARAYYILGEPLVEDIVYDNLVNTIAEIEQTTGNIRKDSPTQRVGFSILDEDLVVPHMYGKMYSLQNITDIQELKNWPNYETIITPKLDGMSLALYYEKGILIKVLKRGDGEQGEDVTSLAMRMQGIPLLLNHKFSFRVEGEAYCFNFEDIREHYKNHRNYVAGSLALKDVEKFSTRNLSFVAYNITGKSFNNYIEILSFLKNTLQGFIVIDYLPNDNVDVEKANHYFSKKYPYTDGLVYKINDCSKWTDYTSHHPKFAVAYKFPQEAVQTKLVGVEWSIGKLKQITPVALLEPVSIGGVTVSRASLANMENIKIRDIHINDTVNVVRAGEVIPQVISVAKCASDRISIELYNCPNCAEPVENINGQLFCKNKLCDGGLIKSLTHFTKNLEIKGLGVKTISQLVDSSTVKTPLDIMLLDEAALLNGSDIGEKNAAKVIANVEKAKQLPRYKLWAALSIPGLGTTTAKSLSNKITTLCNVSEDDLRSISKIGEVTASKILTWVDGNIIMLTKLEKIFLNIVKYEEPSYNKGTIVITGTMDVPRKEIAEKLRQKGWKIGTSISKNTTFLLVGEKPGKKVNEARIKNIPILNYFEEQDKLNLI